MNNNDPKLKNIIWHSYARCSTELQTKSTKGQFLQAEEICKKYKWNLSEKTFEDFGVSGANKKNWTRGQLGMFFDAVDNEEIETPCGLILESIQRFSRSDPLEVASKFREYIRKGVFIHLVQEDFTYELDDIAGDNYMKLFVILFNAMTNAQELAKKTLNQQRGIDYKQKNTLKGNIDHYSKICPSWIDNVIVGQYSDGKPKYEYQLNEEKAEVVRRIFDDRIAGIGTKQIADNLNADEVPQITGHDSPWTYSIVANILRNRAVCGYLRFYINEKKEDKFGNVTRKKVFKRDKDGNPLEVKLYPIAVTEQKFQEALLEMDKSNGLTRSSKKEVNTFSRLCVCGYCKKGINLENDSNKVLILTNTSLGKDFSMHRKDNGKGVYFRCSNPNCKSSLHEYYLEKLVFKYLNEVNLDDLFGKTDDKELKKVESMLKSAKTDLNKLHKSRDKIFEMLMEDDSDEFLAVKYSDIKEKIQSTQKSIKSLETRVLKETSSTKNLKKDWSRVLEMINDPKDAMTNRMRLNKLLRDKISKIRLFGKGLPIATPTQGFTFDSKKYTMTNKLMKGTIGIRIEFKGNVTRQIIYNEETESAVVATGELNARVASTNKAIRFNLNRNPKSRKSLDLKKTPILADENFIADMNNKDLSTSGIARKYNVRRDFVQYHRRTKIKRKMQS